MQRTIVNDDTEPALSAAEGISLPVRTTDAAPSAKACANEAAIRCPRSPATWGHTAHSGQAAVKNGTSAGEATDNAARVAAPMPDPPQIAPAEGRLQADVRVHQRDRADDALSPSASLGINSVEGAR